MGEEIAACMKAMLQQHKGLWENIRCLITDRCPAQVSANRQLLEQMNQDWDATSQVFQVCCLIVETSRDSSTRHSTPVYYEVNELGINRIERVITEKFVCDLTESSALG